MTDLWEQHGQEIRLNQRMRQMRAARRDRRNLYKAAGKLRSQGKDAEADALVLRARAISVVPPS